MWRNIDVYKRQGRYLFRMDAPSYSNPGEYSFESVADPSRGEWIQYTDECESHDFEFTDVYKRQVYKPRFELLLIIPKDASSFI